MPDPPKKKTRNVFTIIVGAVKDVVEWVEATFGDPAAAREIKEDLGLNTQNAATPPPVDPAKKTKLETFSAKQDIDELALAQVAEDVMAVVENIRTFADAVKGDGVTAQDVFSLLFRVWVVEWLRVRNPSGYALCQLLGLITSEEDVLEQLDPEPLLKTLRGNATTTDADVWIDRLSSVVGESVVVADIAWRKVGGTIDALYGWDPLPGSSPDAADAAARTLTVVAHPSALGAFHPALTLVGVHSRHGGPGILVALSGHIVHSETFGGNKVTLDAGANGAFAMFIPFGGGSVRSLGTFAPSLALTIEPDPADPTPAMLFGTKDGSRFEIGGFGLGMHVDSTSAGIRVSARKGKIVISLGKADGFLKNLPAGALEVPFDFGVVADTADGVRLDGGTGLKVNLPVSGSVLGVFTVQYLEAELALAAKTTLTIHGGFTFKLGPFQATVDRIGLLVDVGGVFSGTKAFGDLVAFSPPKGIGLVLDAGVVRGGGYLLIDAERGEYAGALELKFATFSIKALALITTKRPDGSEGWSLLILIYGQFSVHLAFGIFLNGVGGLIGLHHRADLDALTDGMKSGALDDILFPENPVADAPRIINRYRTLFPIEEDSLLLGPMLQLTFSQPPIVYINIGIIFEIANALGGDKPAKLTKAILLGQVLVQLPPRDLKVPAILKLLIDIVGFYDVEQQFLMIRSRLRDSFVGIEGFAKLTLSGEQLIAMRFSDPPSFVLSAGGYHPAFKDVPAGVPLVLERMAVSFSLGPIKFRAEQYFAITSNSVQTGLKIEIKADFGVASIEGWLAFDALLYLTPVFRFLAEIGFHVAVRAFSRNLASVDVHLLLEGPGEWHATGSFSFSILWWDVEVGFDERWGRAPSVEPAKRSALKALQEALADPAHVEPGPPVGGSALVTLAAAEGALKLAHPLGRLAIRQAAVPLGVQIDRIGTNPLSEGPSTYAVSAQVRGDATTATDQTTDWFARGQFMELTDQQKLDGRSFERFTSGVIVGTERYVVPSGGRQESAAYERKILEPSPGLTLFWRVEPLVAALGATHVLRFEVAEKLAPFGAAGRSDRARAARLGSASSGAAKVDAPELAVVNPKTLEPVVSLIGAAATSPSTAGEIALAAQARVIEAYEVTL